MMRGFGRLLHGWQMGRIVASASGLLLTGSVLAPAQWREMQLRAVNATATRKIAAAAGVDSTGLNLRLYQYHNCPFCSKVRAFLNYYGFAYDLVEVNPVNKKQIKFSDYKKVPIVVVGLDAPLQLNDSSMIISFLRSYMYNPKADLQTLHNFYPAGSADAADKTSPLYNPNKYFLMFPDSKVTVDSAVLSEERRWRQWVDEHFVHLISPNIYSTMKEALQTFNWFSEVSNWRQSFPAFERLVAIYVGATAMFFVSKRLRKKHNLKGDVRQSLYDGCNEWLKAVGPDRPFMGGQSPNLADLAMYGALSSFEGCEAFQDAKIHTNIGVWFGRMKELVESRAGSKELRFAFEKKKDVAQ